MTRARGKAPAVPLGKRKLSGSDSSRVGAVKQRPAATQSAAQVQAYLRALPASSRRQLERLRHAIRAAAPEAVESFGYGMPAFRLGGKGLVWYAAWKTHVSLYPVSAATTRTLAASLRRHDTSGRGTVRFRLDEPLPSDLVRRLVEARISDVRSRLK